MKLLSTNKTNRRNFFKIGALATAGVLLTKCGNDDIPDIPEPDPKAEQVNLTNVNQLRLIEENARIHFGTKWQIWVKNNLPVNMGNFAVSFELFRELANRKNVEICWSRGTRSANTYNVYATEMIPLAFAVFAGSEVPLASDSGFVAATPEDAQKFAQTAGVEVPAYNFEPITISSNDSFMALSTFVKEFLSTARSADKVIDFILNVPIAQGQTGLGVQAAFKENLAFVTKYTNIVNNNLEFTQEGITISHETILAYNLFTSRQKFVNMPIIEKDFTEADMEEMMPRMHGVAVVVNSLPGIDLADDFIPISAPVRKSESLPRLLARLPRRQIRITPYKGANGEQPWLYGIDETSAVRITTPSTPGKRADLVYEYDPQITSFKEDGVEPTAQQWQQAIRIQYNASSTGTWLRQMLNASHQKYSNGRKALINPRTVPHLVNPDGSLLSGSAPVDIRHAGSAIWLDEVIAIGEEFQAQYHNRNADGWLVRPILSRGDHVALVIHPAGMTMNEVDAKLRNAGVSFGNINFSPLPDNPAAGSLQAIYGHPARQGA